jgi:hypothetical protein
MIAGSLVSIIGHIDNRRYVVIDWPNLLVGTAIGFLLSIAVEWWFGLSASKELRIVADELKHESRELRHQNEITLNTLAGAGMFNPNRDETGRIIGSVYTLSGTATGTSSVTGTLVAVGSGSGLASSPPADAE